MNPHDSYPLGNGPDPEELLPPLLAILEGWAVLPADLLRAMLRPGRAASVDLDAEQRRLLRAIAAGRSTVDIAEELHVSERTVKRMTAASLRTLRVSNRAEQPPSPVTAASSRNEGARQRTDSRFCSVTESRRAE